MRHFLVLLAVRHPGMLDGIRRMLEQEVESVMMVADEVSLLQAAQRTLPDLVIAELSLPVVGAANVVHLLKKHFPALRIIIISAHDDAAVLEEVMAAGVEGYVLQRRIAVDLLPAMHEIRLGRRYVSPDVQRREKWCAAPSHESWENGAGK